jgi:hypothetical protein
MKKLIIAAAPILLLAGCYPQGPEYVEDTDIVYTTYEETYDFDATTTYAMPDQIVVDVKVDDGDTTYEYMADKFATPILEKIKQNMEARGWSLVDIEDDPNLTVMPAGLSSTTYYYSYWYDWWYGGWYGWYYPPYYTVSSYTTGTLIIVIADPSQAADSPINRSQALWVGAINGLAGYNYDITRLTAGVDQAFAQSPYLTTN